MIDSNGLRSALYARNPVQSSIQDRLDAVHKAQHVGKRGCFSVQHLDAFTLVDKPLPFTPTRMFSRMDDYVLRKIMSITKKLNTPGEHAFFFPGQIGPLEVVLTVPEHVDKDYIAILGHPHSLQGGTMNNKVVTTLARLFKELCVPSIRFNFRGVGQSAGVYDEGIGESEDMLFLARQWQQEIPHAHFLFAGFSFGSYVAYRTAAQWPHSLLITIAPPVHHYDYTEFSAVPSPWVIVQGDRDEVVPEPVVLDFVAKAPSLLHWLSFEGTGHFFHGKLLELKHRLTDEIRKHVTELCD